MEKIHFFEFSDLNREPITFSNPKDFEHFCIEHGIRPYAFNEVNDNEVASVCIPDTNVLLMKDVENIAASKEVLKKALLPFDFNLQSEKTRLLDNSNGHDYVEIGGIKWATMNIGAEKPTDTGLYFAWGETKGYTAEQVKNCEKVFIWSDYKYSKGSLLPSKEDTTKYNSTDYTVLQPEDDAVTADWGGSWRLPTKEEFDTLRDATTSVWTDNYKGSGVAGLVLTDKTNTSKKLFFPACGFCFNGSVYIVGGIGLYWSSSLNSSYVQHAYDLNFSSGGVDWQNYSYRCYGYAVRGVLGENS